MSCRNYHIQPELQVPLIELCSKFSSASTQQTSHQWHLIDDIKKSMHPHMHSNLQ